MMQELIKMINHFINLKCLGVNNMEKMGILELLWITNV